MKKTNERPTLHVGMAVYYEKAFTKVSEYGILYETTITKIGRKYIETNIGRFFLDTLIHDAGRYSSEFYLYLTKEDYELKKEVGEMNSFICKFFQTKHELTASQLREIMFIIKPKIELSEWIVIDGYCATRVIKGTDSTKIENRVAFIEKSPRVRIAPFTEDNDQKNWKYLDSGTSEYGFDEDSRKICDSELLKLGYTFKQ